MKRFRWGERLRQAPVGVLVLGTALLFLGAGFTVGGAWLALVGPDRGWMAWLTAIVIGPLVLYMALGVLRRSRWAWLALATLLLLLLASVLLRVFRAPSFPLALAVEVLLELAALWYLARPRVRAAFGR